MARVKGLNRCCYGSENFYVRCFFNIYQSRKGTICITLADRHAELSLKQINELKINVYSLEEFDYNIFKKAYNL